MITSLANVLTTVESIITGDRDEIVKNKNINAIVSSGGSIVRLVSVFNLEPYFFITEKASRVNEIQDVMSLNLNLLTLFYTQALTTLTEIYEIKPDVAFDILSTKTTRRGYAGYAELGKDIGHALESLNIAVETIHAIGDGIKEALEADVQTKDNKKFSSTVSRMYVREFTVSLNINRGQKDHYTIEIPMSVKSKNIITNTIDVLRFLEDNSYRTKAWFRLDQALAGGITWKNFFLGNDLIKKRKQNRLRSKEDLHSIIRDVTLQSTSKLAAHGALGYDMFYNSVFITAEEVEVINSALKNKLYTEQGKDEFLFKFRALNVDVIDTEWEAVDIFTKDIEGYSSQKLSKLKDKSETDKLADVFKNMLNNKPLF